MADTRHSMAETIDDIKHELAEAFEWKTYVQCYPGTCLMAGGAVGWILGRRLRSQSHAVPAQPKIQASESPSFARIADKVVSSVLAQALPLIAATIRSASR